MADGTCCDIVYKPFQMLRIQSVNMSIKKCAPSGFRASFTQFGRMFVGQNFKKHLAKDYAHHNLLYMLLKSNSIMFSDLHENAQSYAKSNRFVNVSFCSTFIDNTFKRALFN